MPRRTTRPPVTAQPTMLPDTVPVCKEHLPLPLSLGASGHMQHHLVGRQIQPQSALTPEFDSWLQVVDSKEEIIATTNASSE